MISNYIEKEDTIILYLDYSFEIGSLFNEKENSFFSIIEYLKNKKVAFDSKKIVLFLGSILIGTFIYLNGSLKKVETINNVDVQTPVMTEKVEENKTDNTEELTISQEKIEDIKQEEIKLETSSKKNDKENILPIEKENLNKKNESVNKKDPIVESFKQEVSDNKYVTVCRSNGVIEKIELEEYIVGVVSEEMPASFNIEALKAQAIIARTYALDKISKGENLTDTVSTQAYIDKNQMKIKWGSDYDKYYNKVVKAVNSTKGEVVTYNGKYIEALYHSVSNGKTESAKEVWGKDIPYLKSVDSSWDKNTHAYLKIDNKEFNTVITILGIDVNKDTIINIISKDKSGRVSEIQVGEKVYTGVEFRTLLGLRSTDFDITITEKGLEIITRGYGHGVGLSQYGANEMAKLGYSYKDIINHYYSNVKIQ